MSASQHMRRLGQPIAYFPELARMLGGVNASLFFSQLFYWMPKSNHPDGVYKTATEIEAETGLTAQEQRTARKKLVDLGVLVETHKRIEHRLYFRLDLERFDELYQQHSGSEESTFAKSNSNIPEMQNQHSGSEESTFDELQNQRSYKEQENTKKLQQETTAGECSARDAHAPPPAPPKPERKPKAQRNAEAFIAFLAAHGIPERVSRSWWQYRDGKPMTELAWERHCRQAAKAGITPQEAAAYAAGREWRAFYADGYQRDELQADFGRNGYGQQKTNRENHAGNQGCNRKLTPYEAVVAVNRRNEAEWFGGTNLIDHDTGLPIGGGDEWDDDGIPY